MTPTRILRSMAAAVTVASALVTAGETRPSLAADADPTQSMTTAASGLVKNLQVGVG